MSISALNEWQYVTLISPVFTYVLLVYISGVRLLEESGKEKWGHLEEYKKYLKNTPSLLINFFEHIPKIYRKLKTIKEVELNDEEGNKIKHGPRFSLCGCTKSKNLPFCDGAHKS